MKKPAVKTRAWKRLAAVLACLCLALQAATAATPNPPRTPDSGMPLILPGGLIGATAGTVRARFGPPKQIRQEGAVEIWVYQSRTCHLDLVLERTPVKPELSVIHVGARARDGLAATDEARCIRDMETTPR